VDNKKNNGEFMDSIIAGLAAWFIELSIMGLFLYILYKEEQKVYRERERRKKEKYNE
tara:strand:+ start:628 stop:798 length:171 start_codon:yes stop_codon:yes gene_type:complete